MEGWEGGGSQAPSLSPILEQTRLVQSENFFIDRCSKDVPTNTKLFGIIIIIIALTIEKKNQFGVGLELTFLEQNSQTPH